MSVGRWVCWCVGGWVSGVGGGVYEWLGWGGVGGEGGVRVCG